MEVQPRILMDPRGGEDKRKSKLMKFKPKMCDVTWTFLSPRKLWAPRNEYSYIFHTLKDVT